MTADARRRVAGGRPLPGSARGRRPLYRAAHLGIRAARIATAHARVLPDFLIIGAMKGGTSTLYGYLRQHPDVHTSGPKEVHFFDLNYNKGVRWYRSNFPIRLGRARGWQTGEGDPDYLFDAQVPARVSSVVPQAKLIVVLRDPVSRTRSHYEHNRARGQEPLSLSAALDKEPERLAAQLERVRALDPEAVKIHNRFAYVGRSLYAQQLERWFGFFPREQFLILKSEELFEQPVTTMAAVFRFLGLRDVVVSSRRINAGSYDKSNSMDAEVRARLDRLFETPSRDLERLLGNDPDRGLHP